MSDTIAVFIDADNVSSKDIGVIMQEIKNYGKIIINRVYTDWSKESSKNWLKTVEELGAGEILLTSMDRDGTKSGFDLDILSLANDILNIPIIASGGVGTIKHFYDGVSLGKADALLAASVFHFNEFSIMDVKNYLKKNNINVRI